MRTKISKLAKGIFDKTTPELAVSVEMIQVEVPVKGRTAGNFTVESLNGIDARGVIYSDSTHITLKDTSFIGTHAVIHYEVHADGVKPGKHLKGVLQIVSDAGELSVPYEILVEDPYVNSSMGKLKNLFHFTNLVRNHYEEALELFQAPCFPEIFLPELSKEEAVYESLICGISPETALEEFLVCVNKKSRIHLSLEKTQREYLDFQQTLGDVLLIKKDTWGYAELDIVVDGDFIQTEYTNLTTQHFTGNRLELFYKIEEEKIHNGYNFGKITVRTPYQCLECEILVYRHEERTETAFQWKEGVCQLSNLYFAFRMHQISTDIWCRDSIQLIEKMRNLQPENAFMQLLEAQVLITMKKKGEAAYPIQKLEQGIVDNKWKAPFLYSYYLYVKTLYTRDHEVARDAAGQVKQLHEKYPMDARILWVLLYLDEECATNRSLKLVRIKEQFLLGCCSPFLYYEACMVMNEYPLYIRVLNHFELQTAWWGITHGILNEKASIQIAELAGLETGYQLMLVKFLKAAYEKYRNKLILEALLSCMLKHSRMDPECFSWYAEGVDRQVEITGLYEAYMNTIPAGFAEELPKVIQMYFVYDQALDSRAKEILYSNIIRHGAENSALLRNYMPAMERFAVEQLLQGNISAKLAQIYELILSKGILNKELAEKLPSVLLTRQLRCSDESVCYIILRHKELNWEWRIPLENGVAYFPVYTEEYAMVFEDRKGRRFYEHVEYRLRELLHQPQLIKDCREYAEGDCFLWLFYCEKGASYYGSRGEQITYFEQLAETPYLKEAYRNQMNQKMIEYCTEICDEAELERYLNFLMKNSYSQQTGNQLTDLFLLRGMYEEGWQGVSTYGLEGVALNRLLRLCMNRIFTFDWKEDNILLKACSNLFKKGKYEEMILKYLILYYNNTTKEMVALWRAAVDFGVDTTELEERILVQTLFTGTFVTGMVKIFESYYRNGRNRMVIDAYLAYESYLYFVKQTVVEEQIFKYLIREYQMQDTALDICQMALLFWYAEHEIETETDRRIAEQMLEYLCQNGKYFAFYRKLTEKINIPISLRDKTMIEYRTEPGRKVEIHYYVEDGQTGTRKYAEEPMEHIYEGIYGKKVILFYGENLQYYVTEGEAENSVPTESDAICMSQWSTVHGESRYDMLNDVCASQEMHDGGTLAELMQSYMEKKYLVEKNSRLV